jgi:integrase
VSIHRLKPSEIADLIEEPGKHPDGGGLYLQVASAGQASWVYRFTIGGKERWKSLGPAALYTLDDVREKAHELRRAKHKGIDPRDVLRADAGGPAGVAFSKWLEKYLAEASPHWRGGATGQEAKHYRVSFGKIPDFAALPIDGITEHDKNEALKAWDANLVTRRKMAIRIDAIRKFAATGKIRSRGKAPEVKHHEAMPAASLPAFFAVIAAKGTIEARALQWTILTAARTNETLGATWKEISEVDGQPTWVIPGERMKAGKTHRVPLTPQMLALIGERRGDDDFLFRGYLKREGGLHAQAMRATMKSITAANGFTVHGFRSTFRDWVGDETEFDRTLAEWSLAHAVGSKLERDYARSDLLAKRRPLMEVWSKFCAGE